MSRRLIFLIFSTQLLSFSLFASPPQSLLVPVIFTVENGNYDLSYVVVKKNGVALFTKAGEKNLKLKLEYGNEYLLSFGKEGYITKQILLNTSVPAGIDTAALEPYKIGVRIFKQYEGVNIVIYNQPVGFIHFIPEEEGFGYDTDYTKSILSELESTEKVLIQKSKEEKELTEQKGDTKQKDQLSENNKQALTLQTQKDAKVSESLKSSMDSAVRDSSFQDQSNKKKRIEGKAGQDQPQINLGVENGEDQKGNISISIGEDKIQQHLYVASGEDPIFEKKSVLPEVETITHEIVEKNRKITEVEVFYEEKKSIIRKVVYNWGGVYFYNVDNKTISEDQFYSIIKNSKRVQSK
ncbi:MAG: hypothetical protein ACKOX3_08485 [Bacteroidota bacterium]